jgi:hypothetical protein
MTLVERGLLVAASGLVSIAVVGWFTSTPTRAAAAARVAPSSLVDVGVAPAESIDVAAQTVAKTDPFRLDRRPASVAYRPELEGVVPPPKPPKPALVLEGLVGSTALLDGVPGRSGTAIVHAGDTLGGLRVKHIGRDTVIVSGADTIWRLTVRRTWQ